MNSIIERIRDVWGDRDDFKKGGYHYVRFVMWKDLSDIDDEFTQVGNVKDEDQIVRELSDLIINATRAIDELSDHDPEDAVIQRLDSRMDGQTEDIIEKYQEMYYGSP